MRFIPLIFLGGLLLTSSASADELVTKDGQLIQITKARTLADGRLELTFKSGRIVCAPSFVKSVQIEGNMEDYVPQNGRERENLAKGYVRHKDKWMSKASYVTLLAKQAAASLERLAELEAHAAFRNGYQLETKHFKLKSNTSPEQLAAYAELLECYYALMDDRVGIDPTPTLKRTKMKVNIYKHRGDWIEHHPDLPAGVVGYFSPSEQALNFFHNPPDPSITQWVALHECTHLLTYLIQPTFIPAIWVNEGVADFFGSATVITDNRGKVEIIPGRLQVDRMLTVKDAIQAGKHTRLEELFQLSKADFGAFEYAHAWSFVYFLNNDPRYVKPFKRFFKDLYNLTNKVKFEWNGQYRIVDTEETRRLLLDSLKAKDVDKLEAEWLQFIGSIELDAPDALFRRGLRVVQAQEQENYESAGLDLFAALEAGVADPRLLWALGIIQSRDPKLSISNQGIDLLRQAIQLAPFNAEFRASLAVAQLISSRRTPLVDLEVHQDILRNLGLASELAPDNEYFTTLFENIGRELGELASASQKRLR